MEDRAEQLRIAIENLINVKLHDALAHNNGLDRLIAHRCNGVASRAVREAESQLQTVLSEVIARPRPARSQERREQANDGSQRHPRESLHENRTSRPAV